VSRNTSQRGSGRSCTRGLLRACAGAGTSVAASSELPASPVRAVRRSRLDEVFESGPCSSCARPVRRPSGGGKADVARLRRLLARRWTLDADQDPDVFVRADLELHVTVAASAQNGLPTELYDHLGTALADSIATWRCGGSAMIGPGPERTPGHPGPPAGRGVPSGLLLAGILLVAANLRASLTAIGPLLSPISQRFGLSGTEAGLLTTLPLLAFAACSPLAPRVSRRLGPERTLLWALLVLAAGIVLRSLPRAAALFGGTLVLGAAIAVANVLLPAVVKHRFPARMSLVTGLYVGTMGLVGAAASGTAVPLAQALPAGWPAALACWAGLVLLGAGLWAGCGHPANTSADPAPAALPWRSPLAWCVTAYMGLQSFGFYVVVAWLPTLLESRGTIAHAAGWLLSAYQLAGLVTSFLLPLVVDRMAGQRLVACAAALCCGIAYAGLLLAPALATVWALVAGLGSGGCVVLALSFMALRAGDPRSAAALSAMAQSIGYLMAAAGPLLFGLLHNATGSRTSSLLILVASALALAAAGLGAGRPGGLGPPPPARHVVE
jgi:CP family cyanate transporter-like MFS transporter